MNSSTIQGLHGPLRRTGVIVLDKAIVVALGLYIYCTVSTSWSPAHHYRRGFPYILVGDNLDVLDMASGLKDLTQHVLGDPLIQTANVEGPLVGLRRSSSEAGGRGENPTAVDARSGRGDGRRDWVRVLRNMEGRRGEVSWVALAVLGGRGAHARLRRGRNSASVSHCRDYEDSLERIVSATRKGLRKRRRAGGCVGGDGESEEKSVERRGAF